MISLQVSSKLIFDGKTEYFLCRNHWLFNTHPLPINQSCQVFVCWCAAFCFPSENLGGCLAWLMLFPAENSVSSQSKVGEMWGKKKKKKRVTSCRLYVTALPGTKKKKKIIPCCLPTAWGELSLLAVQHRSVKHAVISISDYRCYLSVQCHLDKEQERTPGVKILLVFRSHRAEEMPHRKLVRGPVLVPPWRI